MFFDEIVFQSETSNRKNSFEDINKGLLNGAGEDSGGSNGQWFYQTEPDQQRPPSDEYLNELSKQLTQRDEGANATAISSVRPSPRSYSRDLNSAAVQPAANELNRGYERGNIDAPEQQCKPHATTKTETSGVHGGAPKAKSSMQAESPAPKSSSVHRELPKNNPTGMNIEAF